MSSLKSQEKQQKSYKLKIDKNLEKQIRHLCSKLPSTEYSGTLFYTVTGSFEDEDIEFTAVDFFLQDIGDSTYTSFENESEFASYMLEHDLLDCYTGLMHSHHNMSTFFSNTDMSTLEREGMQRTHFLSLIVNNAGVYNAYVTKKIKVVTRGEQKCSYETYNGQVVDEGVPEDVTIEEYTLEYYKLEVEREIVENDMSELDSRFDEIKTRKADAKKSSLSFYPHETTHYESPKYTTYDTKKDDTNKELSLPFDEYYEYKETPYNVTDKKLEDISDKMFKQLITLDINADLKSTIDIDKWVLNMEKLYDKRFKDEIVFEEFADTFISLLFDINDEFRGLNSAVYYNVIENLEKRLQKCNKNKYIKIYIEVLQSWT